MQTIYLSPTDFVTGDPSLVISYPFVSHPSTLVTCTVPGDFKWVSMGLHLPPNVSIEEITICYQISNPGILAKSLISQIRLLEMSTPEQAMVLHDDGTDLDKTSPECYTSKVGGKVPTPGKAVTLALRLNFKDITDQIMLGVVGVTIGSTMELCANSIADLRALDAGVVPCLTVLGYYEPGDGGGGSFYWDASASEADNAGTVIAPASNPVTGRWKRLVDGPLSVKWFGAIGDGQSHPQANSPGNEIDWAAIQVALNVVKQSGGSVYVPPGTYVISSPLAYTTGVVKSNTMVRGLVLFGDGPDTAIFDNRVANGPMLYAGEGGTDLVFQRGLRLENLGILTTTKPPGSNGIQISHQYNGTIKNCSIEGLTGDAVQIMGTMAWDTEGNKNPDARASAWITLENNQLRRCARGVNVVTTSSQYGVGLLTLRHNYVALNTIGGVRLKGLAVRIEGHGGSENGPASWPEAPNFVDGVAEGAIYFHRGFETNSNRDIIIEGGELDGSRPSQIRIDYALNVSIRNVAFHRSPSISANNINGIMMFAVNNGILSNNSYRIESIATPYTAYSMGKLTQYVRIEKTGFHAFPPISAQHVKYIDDGHMNSIEENGRAHLIGVDSMSSSHIKAKHFIHSTSITAAQMADWTVNFQAYSGNEPNPNYEIFITPSWLTAYRVYNKTATGFHVDFGTPTPDANQQFSWLLMRRP
jgi:hypothetical protein